MKLGNAYHGTRAHLSGILHKSYQSVCLCVYLIVAKQRLGKNVTAATNTHATKEELFVTSFLCSLYNIKGE
jgi:hypothetical protein